MLTKQRIRVSYKMESPSENILVVDDQRAHRKVMSFSLANAGYEVKTAKDAVEALVLATQENFDLVITDYDMPGATGTDLVKELRKVDGYFSTPMILITAKADELDLKQTEHLSVLVLPKPYPMVRLVDTVSSCLARLAR